MIPSSLIPRRHALLAKTVWNSCFKFLVLSSKFNVFSSQKDVHYDERPILMEKTFNTGTKSLKQLFQTVFHP